MSTRITHPRRLLVEFVANVVSYLLWTLLRRVLVPLAHKANPQRDELEPIVEEADDLRAAQRARFDEAMRGGRIHVDDVVTGGPIRTRAGGPIIGGVLVTPGNDRYSELGADAHLSDRLDAHYRALHAYAATGRLS